MAGDLRAPLQKLAYQEGRRAALAGDLRRALDWLARAGDSPEAILLEQQIRLLAGRRAATLLRNGEAESHLKTCGDLKGPLSSAAQRSLGALKTHAAERAELLALSKRFGTECEACRGDDLWVRGKCIHQRDPIPSAERVPEGLLRPTVDAVYAAAAYRSGWDRDKNSSLSRLIRREKHVAEASTLAVFGTVMAHYLAFHTSALSDIELIVPVPTSLEREEERGRGIPVSLSRTIAALTLLPMEEAIIQASLHRDHREAQGEERAASLRRAWRVAIPKSHQRSCTLLIDDVLTTGVTLRTAARMLRAAGIPRVLGLVLAHTERSS